MAALLKNIYDQTYLEKLCEAIKLTYPSLDQVGFIHAVFDEAWHYKELKARTIHIADTLHHFIRLDYPDALGVIQHVAKYFTGYQGMFLPAFVEQYGVENFSISIDALAYITQFASGEFAIRPFILKYPVEMQHVLLMWTQSDNPHIRRLASEGSRPRLPWAMALPIFKQDPTYVLPILENLKFDSSEYVRRSVANHLNDIAKDHPILVIDIAQRWLKESDKLATRRLVKHACRTLLKQAHPQALALFGFLPPDNIQVSHFKVDKMVNLGEVLCFSCQLTHRKGRSLNKLRVEFAIDFMKKNGQQARKIFQISESVINHNIKVIEKSFSFKMISTRQYYAGRHTLAILVNGVELESDDFILSN
jgi:3-methyladenine DNA glycosylase AlkC